MFAPSRLTLARHRRGFSLVELADASGISTRSLSAYENGQAVPLPTTLEQLAKTLGFPLAFFAGPEAMAIDADRATFRSLSSMSAGERDAALAGGALALEFSRWIDARFRLPGVEVPDLSGQHPELAAEELRRLWGLDERPIRHMVDLLELHGVRVFSLAEATRKVDAFSVWSDGRPHVFLNTVKSAEHNRFDAAHELGHLVLHRRGQMHGRAIEDQAQRFASAFLMPRTRLLASLPQVKRLETLMPTKKAWGVSLYALVVRLEQIGALSAWQARNFHIEVRRLGYHKAEPDGMPRETSQLLRKVDDHLRRRGRSLRDVAQELHLPAEDLDQLVFGLTLVPVDGGATPGRATAARGKLRLVD
jgi:Zn-dependent peptidase ImmA (M78 family)